MYSDIIEKHLPGYKIATDDEQSVLWDPASPQVIYELNADIQLERGQGLDKLSMCELGREDEQMGNYTDLLSYDLIHWVGQQNRIFNKFPEVEFGNDEQGLKMVRTTPSDYINQYSGNWFRLFYREKFTYGNLYSAVHFILEQVEERVGELLESKYPYTVVMKMESSELLDENSITITADNDENLDQVVDIKLGLRPNCLQFQSELNHRLNGEPVATYIIERQDDDGFPSVDFVCHNDTALRLVRPLRFVKDMTRYQKSREVLDTLVNEYYARVQALLINEM